MFIDIYNIVFLIVCGIKTKHIQQFYDPIYITTFQRYWNLTPNRYYTKWYASWNYGYQVLLIKSSHYGVSKVVRILPDTNHHSMACQIPWQHWTLTLRGYLFPKSSWQKHDRVGFRNTGSQQIQYTSHVLWLIALVLNRKLILCKQTKYLKDAMDHLCLNAL